MLLKIGALDMQMNGLKKVVFCVLVVLTAGVISGRKKQAPVGPVEKASGKATSVESQTSSRKVLVIHSYHAEYPWSRGIDEAIRKALDVGANGEDIFVSSSNDLTMKVFWMDTKRNTSIEFINDSALKAKEMIETWKPDVVICSDDNAFRYLVMPFYKDADLPFVFCGVNWDVSKYDNAPYTNTTGMIEVWLIPSLIEHLSKYSNGARTGYMTANVQSETEILSQIKKTLKVNFDKEVLVGSFEEWKSEFVRIQEQVDILIWANHYGIKGWDDDEAEKFVFDNTKIPTGTISPWMTQYTVMVLAQSPQEQGQWSAKAALEILDGKSPKDIPTVTNRKGKIYLNMAIANKLGIVFPMDIIRQATFAE